VGVAANGDDAAGSKCFDKSNDQKLASTSLCSGM
jgi:hypothetical protein